MLDYICQLGRGWERQIAEDVRQQLLWQLGRHSDDMRMIAQYAVWWPTNVTAAMSVVVEMQQYRNAKRPRLWDSKQLDWSPSELQEMITVE